MLCNLEGWRSEGRLGYFLEEAMANPGTRESKMGRVQRVVTVPGFRADKVGLYRCLLSHRVYLYRENPHAFAGLLGARAQSRCLQKVFSTLFALSVGSAPDF